MSMVSLGTGLFRNVCPIFVEIDPGKQIIEQTQQPENRNDDQDEKEDRHEASSLLVVAMVKKPGQRDLQVRAEVGERNAVILKECSFCCRRKKMK